MFFRIQNNRSYFLSHKSSCKSKFQRLIEMGSTFSKTDNIDPHDNLTDSWFINISDTRISVTVAKTLSLGENFGILISLSKLPTKHLIVDFESNIYKIQEYNRIEARLKFVNCLKNFSNQKQNSLNFFQKQVIENSKCTTTFLKNNPHILITKSDKGNTTVAMDKNKYIHMERNNWCHALERDQCLAIVAVQIVELINSSNKCTKFMRAAHSILQRQNTVYSHKKYVILQHLLVMRLIVDTRWAKGAKP